MRILLTFIISVMFCFADPMTLDDTKDSNTPKNAVSSNVEILSEIKADPIKFFKKCAYFLGEIIVPGGVKHFDAWLKDKETLVEFLDNQKRSIADEMAMGLAIGAKAVKANKRLQAMYKYVNFKYEAKLAALLKDKGFYDSHRMKKLLEKNYGKNGVVSSTVPDVSKPNVKLAGKRHKVTGVIFDNKGFPIFDDIAKVDLKIPLSVAGFKDRNAHMRAATRELRKLIAEGKIKKNIFTERQLKDINRGKAKVSGFTWHHHQDSERMQLVSFDIHDKTKHVGGMGLWPFSEKG